MNELRIGYLHSGRRALYVVALAQTNERRRTDTVGGGRRFAGAKLRRIIGPSTGTIEPKIQILLVQSPFVVVVVVVVNVPDVKLVIIVCVSTRSSG